MLGVGCWRLDASRSHNRLERPPVQRIALRLPRAFRPHGTLIDPSAQQPDLLRSERITLGRHLHVGVEAGDELDYRTLGAFAWDDVGGVIVTAGHRYVLQVDAPTPFLLFRPVTLQATAFQDRLDVLLQKSTGRVAAGGSLLRSSFSAANAGNAAIPAKRQANAWRPEGTGRNMTAEYAAPSGAHHHASAGWVSVFSCRGNITAEGAEKVRERAAEGFLGNDEIRQIPRKEESPESRTLTTTRPPSACEGSTDPCLFSSRCAPMKRGYSIGLLRNTPPLRLEQVDQTRQPMVRSLQEHPHSNPVEYESFSREIREIDSRAQPSITASSAS